MADHAPTTVRHDDDHEVATAVLDPLIESLSLPGAAVAVVRAGRPAAVVCRGHAEPATGRRWTPDTLTRIGSISKTVTTAAVLRLVEERALGLDDPVAEHLTEPVHAPAGSEPIRIEHLLTHTSGIGELTSWAALRHPLWAVGGSWPGRPVPTLADLLASGVRAEVAPDTRWVYSNPAFSVLGRLVEHATGAPFDRAVRDLVLEPAGLDDVRVGTGDTPTERAAVGHALGRRGLRPVRGYEVATVSAGGVVASVEGLAEWARLWLEQGAPHGRRVLDPATVADALDEHRGIDPSLRSVGLTLWRSRRGGRLVVSHGGSMPGFSSGMRICPEEGLAVVAVTNRSVPPSAEFGGGRIAGELLDALLGEHAAAAEDAPVRAVPARPVAGTWTIAPGRLTAVRPRALFGGRLEVTDLGARGLDLRGRAGVMRHGTQVAPVDDSGCRWSGTLRGVSTALVLSPGSGERPDMLHLDGIPCPITMVRAR